MDRLTRRTPQGMECDDTSAALEKLARCEDLCQYLEQRQDQLSQKLADLRAAGKTKTTQFRELMGEKLANGHTIALLHANQLL